MPRKQSGATIPRPRVDAGALEARLHEIKAELQLLDEEEQPTDDDVSRAEELLAEFDEVTLQHSHYARRAAILRALGGDGHGPNVISGDDDRRSPGAGPDLVIRHRTEAYDGLSRCASLSDLGSDELCRRADSAISLLAEEVPDSGVSRLGETFEATAARDKPATAELIVSGSDPIYRSAFEKLIRYPQIDPRALLSPEESLAVNRTTVSRAALSLTSANGGYMVPFTLDPTIILSNSGSANPYRAIANIKSTATNTWNGVTSAGINAAWLAEAGVVGDNTPTIGNIVITPQKAAAWVFGSYEILEDSDFATQLPVLLGDAKDRLEEAAFTTGTGTGQPRGIVTAATTTVATAAVATYAIGDVYAVQQALPARFRRNASWVMAVGTINSTRRFDSAGGSSFWTNLGAGAPETLLGGPIHESSTIVSTTTTGSKIAVYGDFSQYAIVDRIGMSVMYEPLVKDTTTGRPTGQGGWLAFFRTGADALLPGAFRVLVTG